MFTTVLSLTEPMTSGHCWGCAGYRRDQYWLLLTLKLWSLTWLIIEVTNFREDLLTGGEVVQQHVWTSILCNMDGHGDWANWSLVRFKKEAFPLLHLGQDSSTQRHRLRGASCWHWHGCYVKYNATQVHSHSITLTSYRAAVEKGNRLKEVIILFCFH